MYIYKKIARITEALRLSVNLIEVISGRNFQVRFRFGMYEKLLFRPGHHTK